MDKLKVKVQKYLLWFNNLSIKSSYIAYMTITLLISASIGVLIMWGITIIRDNIYIYDHYQISYNSTKKYTQKVLENEFLKIVERDNEVEYSIVDKENGSSMSISVFDYEQKEVKIIRDKQGIVKAIQVEETTVETISIVDWLLVIILIMSLPITFFVGCIVCSILFFKYKLNPPLQILMEASDKISENELDFNIKYNSKDEMGQLCSSFEIMRQALYENQKELWRNIEERKRLNSAFSHDLRTPLTVLKGYSEILLFGIENNTTTKDNLIQTVTTMSNNINRLERYTYEMSRMQKLEDISINKKNELTYHLLHHLKEAGEILSCDLTFTLRTNISERELNIDLEIVMQVYENLIANSKRYARSKIIVNCHVINHELIIEVIDDGKGFSSEGLIKAVNPFFKEQENVNNAHFGLGLYICKLLTEKHGGKLHIANSVIGGAQISANFGRIN